MPDTPTAMEWPKPKLGATCAACGWRTEGRGYEIARPMRIHREDHRLEDFPVNGDDEYVEWNFDPIVLSESAA